MTALSRGNSLRCADAAFRVADAGIVAHSPRDFRMHRLGYSLFPILAVLAASSAWAQNPAAPPPTELTADLGFVSVSGNTAVTTVNIGQRLVRRLAPWEFRQDLALVYGRTDGVESSNLWRAALRGDYAVSSRLAIYARTGFERNKFAGIDARFAEGLGGVLKVLETGVDQMDLQAGLEATQQESLDRMDSFMSLRAAMSWKHALGASASFFQSVEVLPNLDDSDDLRVNSETALVAPLSQRVGIKASYQVRFDNQPALNAAGTAPLRKSDRILSTSIQISF